MIIPSLQDLVAEVLLPDLKELFPRSWISCCLYASRDLDAYIALGKLGFGGNSQIPKIFFENSMEGGEAAEVVLVEAPSLQKRLFLVIPEMSSFLMFGWCSARVVRASTNTLADNLHGRISFGRLSHQNQGMKTEKDLCGD
jgi:hypothetical protein